MCKMYKHNHDYTSLFHNQILVWQPMWNYRDIKLLRRLNEEWKREWVTSVILLFSSLSLLVTWIETGQLEADKRQIFKSITMSWQVEQLKEELSAKEAQGEDLKKRVAGLQAEVSAVRFIFCVQWPFTGACELSAFRGSFSSLTFFMTRYNSRTNSLLSLVAAFLFSWFWRP